MGNGDSSLVEGCLGNENLFDSKQLDLKQSQINSNVSSYRATSVKLESLQAPERLGLEKASGTRKCCSSANGFANKYGVPFRPVHEYCGHEEYVDILKLRSIRLESSPPRNLD